MKSASLRLFCILSSLSIAAWAQTGTIAHAGGELPLLGFVGAGVLTGGVLSILKTRRQK